MILDTGYRIHGYRDTGIQGTGYRILDIGY